MAFGTGRGPRLHRPHGASRGAVRPRELRARVDQERTGIEERYRDAILEEAVRAEAPLRDRNPCDLTRLPRIDDDGIEDDGDDDMEFPTPEEVTGTISCLKREEDERRVRVAYGTGMRWGEITALVLRNGKGERLVPSTFHDLRHSHAALSRTGTA